MNVIKAIVLFVTISTSALAQQHSKNSQIVTEFLTGFSSNGQIHKSLELLSEDYSFTNPIVKLKSKQEFIALAQQMKLILTDLRIIKVAQHGNWISVLYEFQTEIPNVETNIASEWFRVENGKIIESKLIYDASEWRKIYAKLEK